MIGSKIISKIQHIANDTPRVERCGIIESGSVVELWNTHSDVSRGFEFEPRDIVKIMKLPCIVWHTHPKDAYPQLTAEDVKTSKLVNKPVLMVQAISKAQDFFDPNQKLPYEGRTWKTFHRNCFTLTRDWLAREMQIFLNDYFLDFPTEFETDRPSRFLEYIQTEGFKQVTEQYKPGDVVLSNNDAGVPWHCSVIVSDSPLRCLSQWIDIPSKTFPLRALSKSLHSVWRYKPL